MINPKDPAFPDETVHAGVDTLTFIATHISTGLRSNLSAHSFTSEFIGRKSVEDAIELINEINKYYDGQK